MSGYIHRKPRKESPFIRYRFPYVQRWEYLEDNDLRPCHLREYFDDAMNYRVMGNPTPEGIQDEVATAPQELIELLYVPTFPLWYTVTTLCDPRELGIFAYFFRIVGGAVGILLLAFFPLIPFFIVGWFVCKIAVWYIPGWIQLL